MVFGLCGRVGSLLEQRRPDPQAISVAGRARLGLVRSRFPVLHTHRMGIATYDQSPFAPRTARAGRTKSGPRVPRLPRFVVRRRGPRAAARILGFGKRSGHGVLTASYLPKTMLPADDRRARLGPGRARTGRPGSCDAGVAEECYLVDPASSHMLVSKIKPCMCKYEQIQTVKLRMAH